MSRVFALTGGIGAGIDLVAKVFADEGVPVVDADSLVDEVFREQAKELGKGGDPSEAVAAVLTSDPKRKEDFVEELRQRLAKRTGDVLRAKIAEGHPLVCLLSPYLIESGNQERFRPLVVVVAPYERQLLNVMTAGSFTEEEAKSRIQSQIPQTSKIILSDYLLDHKGTVSELQVEAAWVLKRIREAFV